MEERSKFWMGWNQAGGKKLKLKPKNHHDFKAKHKLRCNHLLRRNCKWKKCLCNSCRLNNNRCKPNKLPSKTWRASWDSWQVPRRLSSDTQVPWMEEGKECRAVKLRSGKALPDPYINQKLDTTEKKRSPDMEEESEDGWVEVQRQVPQPQLVK